MYWFFPYISQFKKKNFNAKTFNFYAFHITYINIKKRTFFLSCFRIKCMMRLKFKPC